jgi:asparagine synthase (glutamine-hydrolysing)
MCGIAGIFRLDAPATAGDILAVRRMLDAEAARGPDGAGLRKDGPAVLGHRRLAIIDLSDAAREPMANEDQSVWVTFNGEIYNFVELRQELQALGHRFRSRTDGEVLVHGYEAWGAPGLLRRLRGMFAFGLYDRRVRRLLLARDRMGIKPLYYTRSPQGDVVAFASEVRALARSGVVPPDGDAAALAGFLLLGSVPAPRTMLRDVACLPPGHYLEAGAGRFRVERYWALPEGPEPGAETEPRQAAAVELRARLDDTVRRHLVSDVPLGLFLSGGVDSAGLVALARRHERSALHTLTVAFEERTLDEGARARQVAAHHGTQHHEIRMTSGDFRLGLDGFFEAMDQPTHDGVNTYFIAQAARRAGLTVVLSGAGGDEVFWGYRHYHWLGRPSGWGGLVPRLLAAPAWLRRPLVGAAVALGRVRGREQWARLGYLGEAVSPERVYLALRGFYAPMQIRRLLDLGSTELDRLLGEIVEPEGLPPAAGGPGAFNRLETHRYLHDQLLRDTDVFSMAHAVETRVPYLDHTIVEYVAGLPASLKLHPGVNKPLLVEAVGDPLVAALARRPKMGFSLPMRAWMTRHAALLGPMASATDRLDRREVTRLWNAFRAGRLHWSRAWALVVLGATGRHAPAREAA